MIVASFATVVLIAAVVAFFAGLIIKRLWPTGLGFLAIWPAFISEITFPTLGANGERLGKAIQVAPALAVIQYAICLAISVALFFIGFGIRKWVQTERSLESKHTEDA